MRILGTVFFLSFLAGKLKTFERILLAENKKSWRMRIFKRPYFSKFFGGKLKNFEKNFTKNFLSFE